MERPILTIGHSTRPLEALIAILRAYGVEILADVRTVPRSRTNPQFNREALARDLALDGFEYIHLPRLGGLRKPRPDSTNTAWRNMSFRGFADYMQTEDFEEGLSELLCLNTRATVAIMCAESVPWRCHRSLIADALIAREIEVEHIMSETQSNAHRVTSFANIDGLRVTYPGDAAE